MRPPDEVHQVLRLVETGLNDGEISRCTGIPRPTVRDWRLGKRQLDEQSLVGRFPNAPCDVDHVQTLPTIEYAYLLGQYLGDGYLSQSGRSRSWVLRIAFSNFSEDIKEIFCGACDALDIQWTRPNVKDVAIYRLQSVMRLDKFVGPKY